ncbi:diguanylate cyclase [Sulfurimonas sp.]
MKNFILNKFDDCTPKELEYRVIELTKLLEVSNIVVSGYLRQNRFVLNYVSLNITQFGYMSDDFLSNQVTFLSIIYKDDKKEVLQKIEKSIQEGKTNFSLQFRIVTKDATLRWVDTKVIFEIDKDRMLSDFYVTIHDITSIVAKNNQVKLLAKALEKTDNMVYITDAHGVITYVNDSLVRFTGYTSSELIGSKVSIFKSGEHDNNFYKYLWTTILSGQNYNNVIINKKKDKSLFYLDVHITPIINEYTKEQNYVATCKDITIQMKLEQKLETLAITDSLTQTHNRYKINLDIELHIARTKRGGVPFSLAMLDIDYFKNVNDTYGHYVGDVVLKDLTKIIEKNIREVDSLGRWGGEEFMLLLDNTNTKEAFIVAEKIRDIVENRPMAGHYNITVSIGVSQYKCSENKSTLIQRVDKALYKAKENGRNQVVSV